MTTILRIDGSARTEGSVTRDLTDRLVARLVESNPGSRVVTRDLLGGISLLDNAATVGTALPAEDRTAAQVEALAESDALVAEFLEADFVVLGSPIYNFSVPAAVKAYFDLIARAGLTFKYTEEGPVGLVPDRPTYLVVASGGVGIGTDYDLATPYIRHFLGFLGVGNIRIVGADMLNFGAEAALERATGQLEAALSATSAA